MVVAAPPLERMDPEPSGAVVSTLGDLRNRGVSGPCAAHTPSGSVVRRVAARSDVTGTARGSARRGRRPSSAASSPAPACRPRGSRRGRSRGPCPTSWFTRYPRYRSTSGWCGGVPCSHRVRFSMARAPSQHDRRPPVPRPARAQNASTVPGRASTTRTSAAAGSATRRSERGPVRSPAPRVEQRGLRDPGDLLDGRADPVLDLDGERGQRPVADLPPAAAGDDEALVAAVVRGGRQGPPGLEVARGAAAGGVPGGGPADQAGRPRFRGRRQARRARRPGSPWRPRRGPRRRPRSRRPPGAGPRRRPGGPGSP